MATETISFYLAMNMFPNHLVHIRFLGLSNESEFLASAYVKYLTMMGFQMSDEGLLVIRGI